MGEVLSWEDKPPMTPMSEVDVDQLRRGDVERDDPSRGLKGVTRGAHDALPHRERLERSFGRDLGDLDVALGQEEALGQIGARGALVDGTLVLPQNPDLAVVTHETLAACR